ncbi:mariner transposase [Trichonephila clavipes]|nr:mariner transposase [Trichonephila clavipes]
MMDRISICETLDKLNEIDSFLKRMVIEDEKWITYDNTVRKRSWSKRGEAFQTDETVNSDTYGQQLYCLKLAIDQKRPELAKEELCSNRGVMFHQEQARATRL